MQTFLPYPSFAKSAKILDYRRLGKQRVEARQMLDTLEGRSSGWANHPAVLMWGGYEQALKLYFNVISLEWISRGYKHNMGLYEIAEYVAKPPWLGWEDYHLSHQSNLVRKNRDFYEPVFPGVGGELEYIWPSKAE